MKKKEVTQVTKAMHRTFTGEVVAVSGAKTISVLVKSIKMHPKYKKQYVVSKKFAVHDESNKAVVGNEVAFEECRPLSKRKKWRLTAITR